MKVAIYCRLSEEDKNKLSKKDDSESIQNQKTMLIEYAVNQNWEIFDIYSDDDWTGTDRKRPSFNRLLKDAEKGKFDIILCKSQSRFTRELEMVEKYIHTLFPLWGIRFISIVDNADTANKGNKKARQINGLINEWYLEDLSENIKSVFNTKKRNGVHIGAFALYGYKKDPDIKGHLIIDDEAAEVVREVFNLFSQGYGKSTIARILNESGIPNPTEYKRQKGLRYKQPDNKNSTLWRYFSISDMLVNEMYIGNMVQNKYGSISYKTKINKPKSKKEWIIVEGTHEPIIDKELWDKVQEKIKLKARPCYTGKIGLFARKVKCAHCGYTMRSGKSKGLHYLKCSTKNASKNACIGSFISINRLQDIVLNELRQMITTYLDKGMLEQDVTFDDRTKDKIEKIENDIEINRKKIHHCTNAVKSLYLDKTKGLITDDEFLEFSKEFHQEKEQLEKANVLLLEQKETYENQLNINRNKQEIIEQHLELNKLTREHIDNLIDCIYVSKKDPNTRELPVDIHWKF